LHLYHRRLPVAQEFVALVDRQPAAWDHYVNLNFNWRTTLGRMRREFALALAPHAGSLVIYHNAWCLPLLHDVDGALRRIAACHARPEFHARDLPGSRGLVDGAVGITPAMQPAWSRLLPELAAERACVVPLPIEWPAALPLRNLNEEIVLGYAGRVVREDKRLDRLPDFLHALDATGLRYRFEVLGDGALLPALRAQLGSRVRFYGWTPKDEFSRVLAGWDGIVFFTELEGGPIALLEGMAAGAIPFYPAIGGSVGDVEAPRVDPLCYYPSGDLVQLAANVRDIFTRGVDERRRLRERAQATVVGYTEQNYSAGLIEHLARVAAWPRVSAEGGKRRRLWTDALPLGFVTRVWPRLLWSRR
jgi:glycosyltransferase involved in cell wall biosynthesis